MTHLWVHGHQGTDAMAVKRLDFAGGGPLPLMRGIGEDEERSDFRQVPDTDRGNSSYSDRGQFGAYEQPEPFMDPPDVMHFSGYGASEADIDRGYIMCEPHEDPAYDLSNYKMRSTEPKDTMEDFGNTDSMPSDYEFRRRNQRSRGFLTRPRIPTER